jgi:hypothetical protein
MFPFSMFFKPSVRDLMTQELEEAEKGLLVSQTQRDYADSVVAYQTTRVARLRSAVSELSAPALKGTRSSGQIITPWSVNNV